MTNTKLKLYVVKAKSEATCSLPFYAVNDDEAKQLVYMSFRNVSAEELTDFILDREVYTIGEYDTLFALDSDVLFPSLPEFCFTLRELFPAKKENADE